MLGLPHANAVAALVFGVVESLVGVGEKIFAALSGRVQGRNPEANRHGNLLSIESEGMFLNR